MFVSRFCFCLRHQFDDVDVDLILIFSFKIFKTSFSLGDGTWFIPQIDGLNIV
jgi:hypothetical protein